MGLRVIREASGASNRRNTVEQLTKENSELKARISNLESQLTNAQLALCEVYEMIVGGEE